MKVIKLLKENCLLVLILISATILRLYHLDYQSAWMDEIYTLNVSNPENSFSTLINEVNTREGFPYLYFILIKLLLSVFGYSALVARSFSAIMGVLTIFIIYKFGKLLYTKNVGLIAAILITFSEYCIYVSQDARPYTFYLFGVISSFYGLVLFIKNPTQKNAIIYGLLAGLLSNINFFAFVNLFSQAIIIIYYLYLTSKNNRFAFVKNAVISGIIAIIMFSPNIEKLIKTLKFKSSWIPAPTNESLKFIFNDFLGNSEVTLFIITPLFIYYLINLFKEKQTITLEETQNSPQIFGFTIIFPWVVLYILVVFLKSYTDTSVMISRYFTSILPVFFLILAISIDSISNKIIKFSILTTLIVFMWTNTDIVKKYYDVPSKSQFREVSNFVIKNNKKDEIVYTSLKYWFDFYLNNNNVKFNVIEELNIETVINKMIADPSTIKPFWYVDAHGRPFALSEKAQKFVNENLYIENNFDGFDSWGKHYILLKDVPHTIDISKYQDLKPYNGDSFQYNIETFENLNNNLKIIGWAYFDQQIAIKSVVEILLIKDGKANRLLTQKVNRPDVTSYFKSDFDLSNSGFNSNINTINLGKGTYKIAIYLRNTETKKEGLIVTDKILQK
ncbi:MAG: glycosyltransferase family 39 protein [Flavobacterium sp.]|nr:glycosyltransferase family 39 protein [Flavobacterium sp.]